MTSPVSIRVMRVFISLNHSVSQSYSVKFRYLIVISVSQAISISLTHSLSPPYLSLFSLLRFIDFALFKRNCPFCFYGCILGGTIVPQFFLSVCLFVLYVCRLSFCPILLLWKTTCEITNSGRMTCLGIVAKIMNLSLVSGNLILYKLSIWLWRP